MNPPWTNPRRVDYGHGVPSCQEAGDLPKRLRFSIRGKEI